MSDDSCRKSSLNEQVLAAILNLPRLFEQHNVIHRQRSESNLLLQQQQINTALDEIEQHFEANGPDDGSDLIDVTTILSQQHRASLPVGSKPKATRQSRRKREPLSASSESSMDDESSDSESSDDELTPPRTPAKRIRNEVGIAVYNELRAKKPSQPSKTPVESPAAATGATKPKAGHETRPSTKKASTSTVLDHVRAALPCHMSLPTILPFHLQLDYEQVNERNREKSGQMLDIVFRRETGRKMYELHKSIVKQGDWESYDPYIQPPKHSRRRGLSQGDDKDSDDGVPATPVLRRRLRSSQSDNLSQSDTPVGKERGSPAEPQRRQSRSRSTRASTITSLSDQENDVEDEDEDDDEDDESLEELGFEDHLDLLLAFGRHSGGIAPLTPTEFTYIYLTTPTLAVLEKMGRRCVVFDHLSPDNPHGFPPMPSDEPAEHRLPVFAIEPHQATSQDKDAVDKLITKHQKRVVARYRTEYNDIDIPKDLYNKRLVPSKKKLPPVLLPTFLELTPLDALLLHPWYSRYVRKALYEGMTPSNIFLQILNNTFFPSLQIMCRDFGLSDWYQHARKQFQTAQKEDVSEPESDPDTEDTLGHSKPQQRSTRRSTRGDENPRGTKPSPSADADNGQYPDPPTHPALADLHRVDPNDPTFNKLSAKYSCGIRPLNHKEFYFLYGLTFHQHCLILGDSIRNFLMSMTEDNPHGLSDTVLKRIEDLIVRSRRMKKSPAEIVRLVNEYGRRQLRSRHPPYGQDWYRQRCSDNYLDLPDHFIMRQSSFQTPDLHHPLPADDERNTTTTSTTTTHDDDDDDPLYQQYKQQLLLAKVFEHYPAFSPATYNAYHDNLIATDNQSLSMADSLYKIIPPITVGEFRYIYQCTPTAYYRKKCAHIRHNFLESISPSNPLGLSEGTLKRVQECNVYKRRLNYIADRVRSRCKLQTAVHMDTYGREWTERYVQWINDRAVGATTTLPEDIIREMGLTKEEVETVIDQEYVRKYCHANIEMRSNSTGSSDTPIREEDSLDQQYNDYISSVKQDVVGILDEAESGQSLSIPPREVTLATIMTTGGLLSKFMPMQELITTYDQYAQHDLLDDAVEVNDSGSDHSSTDNMSDSDTRRPSKATQKRKRSPRRPNHPPSPKSDAKLSQQTPPMDPLPPFVPPTNFSRLPFIHKVVLLNRHLYGRYSGGVQPTTLHEFEYAHGVNLRTYLEQYKDIPQQLYPLRITMDNPHGFSEKQLQVIKQYDSADPNNIDVTKFISQTNLIRKFLHRRWYLGWAATIANERALKLHAAWCRARLQYNLLYVGDASHIPFPDAPSTQVDDGSGVLRRYFIYQPPTYALKYRQRSAYGDTDKVDEPPRQQLLRSQLSQIERAQSKKSQEITTLPRSSSTTGGEVDVPAESRTKLARGQNLAFDEGFTTDYEPDESSFYHSDVGHLSDATSAVGELDALTSDEDSDDHHHTGDDDGDQIAATASISRSQEKGALQGDRVAPHKQLQQQPQGVTNSRLRFELIRARLREELDSDSDEVSDNNDYASSYFFQDSCTIQDLSIFDIIKTPVHRAKQAPSSAPPSPMRLTPQTNSSTKHGDHRTTPVHRPRTSPSSSLSSSSSLNPRPDRLQTFRKRTLPLPSADIKKNPRTTPSTGYQDPSTTHTVAKNTTTDMEHDSSDDDRGSIHPTASPRLRSKANKSNRHFLSNFLGHSEADLSTDFFQTDYDASSDGGALRKRR